MSIKKLPDGRYEWRHRVGGRHLKKVFARRTDAVAHDAKVKSDLARGTHVDMTNRTTVAEYFQQWAAMRVVRPGTADNYQAFLRNHLEAYPIGARPLVRVRPSEIQAWVRARTGRLQPETLRDQATLLRAMFGSAVLDGVIARNPVLPTNRLSLPEVDKPKIAPLTIEQVQAWADCAPPHVRAMIVTQAGLGLRIGELLALRLQDVDFMRREVHVTEQIDGRHGGHRVPLKTANSRRVVPLPDLVLYELSEHLRRFPPGPAGYLFTPVGSRRGSRSGALTRGEPWTDSGTGKAYRIAASAAGLPDSASSHDLRHHYASVLLHAGESVHTVAERLGNTAQKVLSVYGHMMPNQEDRTRKAIDAAWQTAKKDAPGARSVQDHP